MAFHFREVAPFVTVRVCNAAAGRLTAAELQYV